MTLNPGTTSCQRLQFARRGVLGNQRAGCRFSQGPASLGKGGRARTVVFLSGTSFLLVPGGADARGSVV